MAAPMGNQFWKLRSKHGRDKLFTSPDLVWEAAVEYFEHCEENPILEKDWVGKDADTVYREKARPFTIGGLCIYLDCDEQTFKDLSQNKDFFGIYTRITQIIRDQKFTGAVVGIYNANIIARDLGLSDKSEVAATHSASPDLLSSIADKINANAKSE